MKKSFTIDQLDIAVYSDADAMPLIDVASDDPAFTAMQRIGATGILQTFGIPYKWANQTWFYPERIVSEYELKEGLHSYYPEIGKLHASGAGATPTFVRQLVETIHPDYSWDSVSNKWKSWNIHQAYDENTALTRRSLSILIDGVLDPFAQEVDFEGNLIAD